MVLTTDIGNSNIVIGCSCDNKILFVERLSTKITATELEYAISFKNVLELYGIRSEDIEGAIISSVVPTLGETIKIAIKNYLNVEAYCVSYKSKLPVKIALDEPKEAGAVRIANAAAAAVFYKLPAIVIDIGTATTFDIVDKNSNFIGGIIAPGPKIQTKSLSQFTSKLPKLKIEAPKSAIGKNTIDAMLSGVVKGHECMVEGMIDLCEKELGQKATIIVKINLNFV